MFNIALLATIINETEMKRHVYSVVDDAVDVQYTTIFFVEDN